jgi:signal transduction histidine kinase/DNA-binding response OmpR family regulator
MQNFMSEPIYSILSFELLVMTPLQGSLFGVLTALSLGGLIYARHRIKTLKNEKAELRQLVNERSELLTYSVDREKKSRENAVQANKSKSILLARINHEVRTPLNGILGMVSLLNETSQTAEQKDYCDTIKDCGDNLLVVVNDIMFQDILSYSKVESGKMELEQSDFDLENSIEEALDVFSVKAAERNVELVQKIGSEIPVHIVGDALRFRQIIMNLLENALSRTQRGEIFLSARQLPSAANSLNLEFEMQDNGSCIDAEKIKLIANGSEKLNTSDAGLAIARKLIQLMGGTLVVNSSSKGTVFKFTIITRPSMNTTRHAVPASLEALQGKKILIVEKNMHVTDGIKCLLEQWRLIPFTASSESQCREILSREVDISLMLVDLHLAEGSGVEFTQTVKEHHKDLPVILLAPAGDTNGKDHAELFASVVFKPLKKDTLSKQILSALLHKGQPSDSKQQSKLSTEFATEHPMRILIAEDNLTNQKLATKILNKLGYKPDVAQHGKEVLEVVSHKTYDVILMDVQMPFMDGLEASRMIRLCLSSQPVIVAMTANTLQGDRDECMKAGMDDYISKPINVEELVTVLEKWSQHIKEKQ